MAGVTPQLNLPKLKRKGLMAHFGGVRAPFYVPSEVMLEGQPLKHGASGKAILKAGSLEGTSVFGLAMQETYVQSDPRHKGHHYPNDTRQELGLGMPIGVLCGHGFAETLNYKGVVAENDQLYYDPADGKLVASGGAAVTGNRLPVRARSAGTNTDGSGPYIVIEFDFPTVTN